MTAITDSSTLCERYREDGFVIVSSALTPAEVDAFRVAALDLLALERAATTGTDGYRKVIFQVHQAANRDGRLRGLARHPRLAAIAALLGPMERTRVFIDQIIVKGPGDRETLAHQDAPFLSFTDERSLNCWVALDSVVTENGALYYLAGSHRLGNLGLLHLDGDDDIRDRALELHSCRVVLAEMRPGDAAFHSCLTVHGAGPNRTSRPRMGYSIQYMPDGVRYNGWRHPFLDRYGPILGDPLVQDCFPLVHPESSPIHKSHVPGASA